MPPDAQSASLRIFHDNYLLPVYAKSARIESTAFIIFMRSSNGLKTTVKYRLLMKKSQHTLAWKSLGATGFKLSIFLLRWPRITLEATQ